MFDKKKNDTIKSYDHEADHSDGFSEYSGQKRSIPKKRSGLKTFLKFILLIVIGFVGIVIYLGLSHPLFSIKRVSILGTNNISKEEILGAIEDPVGKNIFLLDANSFEKTIGNIDGIESVKITKELPNKLDIEIHEKYILAYFEKNDQIYLVDESGKIVGKTLEELGILPGELAALQGLNERVNLSTGEKFSSNTEIFNFVIELENYSYRKGLTLIDFSDENNIVLDYNGVKIEFGTLQDYKYKMGLLEKILIDITTKSIQAKEILLNVGENPVIVSGE